MRGPINFVLSVFWIAIGLSMVGSLKQCTYTMMGYAVESRDQQLSLTKWNQKLLQKPYHKGEPR